MIRDRLKRLAHEALGRAFEERDASRIRVYTAPWIIDGDGIAIPDGAVVFDADGYVLASGAAPDILVDFRWAQRAELGGILLPGLVNAHAQLELGAVDEALPGGLGLRRKLRALREIRRATDELDPDSREAGIRLAVRQSVAAGNAIVGDRTDSLRAVPAMAREGLYGCVFHEIREFSARRAAKAIAAAAVDRARIVPWPEGIRYRLAPHSLYSTADGAMRDLLGRALEAGAVTAVRLAETEEEWDFLGREGAAKAIIEAASTFLEEFAPPGIDPLSYLEQLGGLNERVMLVHMNTATRSMVQKASRAGSPLVLTPRSALHDSGKLPPLVSFLEEGCRIALGTDSPASAPDGSVLREAAELHAAFPEVPAMVLLRAAMQGGADALGIDSVGSFDPGSAPGLLHIDTGGLVPDDPCGWMLRAGTPDMNWLMRPAPPGEVRAA